MLKAIAITLASLGFLSLTACSQTSQTTASNPATTTTSPTPASSSPAEKMDTDKMHTDGHSSGQGGQVVEVGAYQLKLVPEKEANLTHLDVFLQKGEAHTAVANAKIMAQVQLPDGSQKTLNFTYDPGEKHYTAKLPGTAAGEYKVAVLSDVAGEKVNGRFSFKR